MKNSISLIISLALIFTSNGCFGQAIKLSVRGGTFSPYSLYNALANKNPYPQINRFTTSESFCLGTGIAYEIKNRLTYGFNATYRKVNIQLLNAFNSYPSNGAWENYDFDLDLGYKIIFTPKSSLCAILGVGMQKRLEYASGYSQKQYAKPDSIVGISSSDIEIKLKNLCQYLCF